MTRVFFRPGKFAEFDQLMRQDKEHMSALIAKVQTWLHRMRWKKVQYGAWSVIKLDQKIKYRAAALIKIQSSVRGFLTRKRQQPRLSAFKRAKALQNRFNELGPLGSKLSDKSKQQWLAKIQSFSQGIKQLIAVIQDPKLFNPTQASQICGRLDVELNTMMKEIKAQAAVDEQEKMKKMEAKLRVEKERQITELREKEAQEKRLKELRDMEAKRQVEEEIQKRKQKEQHTQNAAEIESQAQRLKQLEQERLDAELARRIAAEEGQVMMNAESSRNANSLNNNNKSIAIVNGAKVDLNKWTYAQLRDTINNSNNIELLFACRQELSSRLQQYHQWKSQNESTNYTNPFSRAPDSVLTNAVPHPEMSSKAAPPPIQRYFRVPFTPPPSTNSASSSTSQTGLWYAHFDGQFIARQMEFRPQKAPILLIAGRDDHKMCELTLDQSQLTRKKGAEILASEFEALWQKAGGSQYFNQSLRM
uniref:Myosin VI cargo binding domain-containing protein n=1 Tax=Panagrolaimus sp. PS1159 TaxID=55785 RepID=A0AC35FUX6_9BILA